MLFSLRLAFTCSFGGTNGYLVFNFTRETEPVEVSSPYPRVKISGNAPLIDKYADIMQVLKSTKKHQVNLEQNFDAIQRARQESHVYGIIEEMAQDRSAAERMRIKQMVDDHIHSMNRHLEKDVMSELQKAEDRMKNDFMIPERDISVPKTKSKFNRNVQSRINTGLKKPLNQKSAVAGKENVPVKARQKPVTASAIRDMLSQEQKPAKIPSNVPRLSQPAFVPKRSSQKEPYLRFRSSSPKSKSGSPVSVTRSRAPSPPMPTAILLSAPLIRASHSPVPLTTSTPVQKTKPKSPSPKKSPRAETPPLISQPAETDRVISPQILNDSCIGDNEKSKEPVYSDDFDESVVESSAPIDIPGYTAPKSTYHGPQFPPKKRSACSDEIAVEIRRKELAENEAVNWIEQELMARMISDHLSSQAPPPSSLPPAKQHLIHDDSSLEEDASVIDESLITDAVGQKGLQLFIDAGVAIDSGMVNALMREVILEKIASTLGQITSDDAALPPPPTAQPRRQPSPPPGLPSAPTFAPIRVHSPPVIVRGTPVPTPEVTPQQSPILPSSPVPQARPHHAPPTPDRTPTPSAMEEINEVRYVDDFEEPDEILIPKPVKLTPDADAIWDMASPPSHEVMTPARSLSPVTSSPPPVVLNDTRTPSPSVQSEVHIILPPPLPEPEVVVQKEDRATSPQAWSEPDADLPAPPAPPCESAESPPPAQSSDDAQEIPQDDEAPKRVATISESSSATSGALSVISDTLNEPFSEGQWMLSAYSEGELPHPPIENEIRNRIRHHLISDGLMHQQSVDDTLQDTDEIHQDQISSTDISQSEGEILHRDPLPNIQSTLAAMAHSQSAQIAAQSAEKSIGEVILPSTSTSEPQKSNVKKAYRMLSAGELSGVPEEPTPSDHGPSTSVTRSTRRHPTLGQVVSTSDEHRPLRRRNSPQASRGSLGLSQSQTFGHSDMAASQHSMRQTASDVDSATTDRLNIEAILQNRDYFNTTQSDLATTTDFQLRASTDQRMAQTAEYSLMDSEVMSADESSALSLGIHVRPPLQVSVTIPSVLDEDSDISPEEISEISLH
ncbi:hypothetical protein CAPTEDRAFT_222760 [Capitella teleta]|uniref:Uncharacterized protein n=1 Tax=Capitella teleta TaxID=283909 RepID=R7TVW4_CAPTE|nr:hypothetical protein CAPTEDRAFT_222760 [Capitella teleta]|eukprot:ELT98048.1 hypothetical protein CAPTEDRAFT_222760 [Capitella teleta]